MNTPNSISAKISSLPRKRHFDSTYPLIAPSSVDSSTAGITIITELMKNGRSPPQSTPVHAELHALLQASRLGALGSDSRLPARTCAMSFSDVVTITYIGSR